MSRKKSFNKISSLILTFAILLGLFGVNNVVSAQTTVVGPAITEMPTSGQYVLVDSEGRVPTTFDGDWLRAVSAPTDLNEVAQYAFTLGVNGDKTTLQDSAGNLLAPTGESNGIRAGEHSWILSNDGEGNFTFYQNEIGGRGIAYNSDKAGYRSYSNAHLNSNTHEFKLHPVTTGETPVDPEPTPAPVVVDAPTFVKNVVAAGETVIPIAATLNDLVHFQVVRDGDVVFEDARDITSSSHATNGRQFFIPKADSSTSW